MGKIKHTKNELKAQKEALTRFERFLPMLQLKKQQLQAELQGMDARIQEQRHKENRIRKDLETWVALFSEPVDLKSFVALEQVDTEEGNIAGVIIPVLKSTKIRREMPDLFSTAPWIDDAVETVATLIDIRIQREVLEEQRRRIAQELRTTSQRVNLFEKVKIPECRENIRTIKIFLGDEQTAAVVRGKITKSRMEREAAEETAS